MTFWKKPLLPLFIALSFVVGCGGGSSSDDSENESIQPEVSETESDPNSDTQMSEGEQNVSPLTGVFIDSPVQGVSYSTATQSGVTNSEGEFTYLPNEVVTFQIGATILGSAMAADQLTPVDITSDANSTINVARLLQSLDMDGNPDNGIVITGVAASSATSLDFSLEPGVFSSDADVINLVANSGGVSTSLVGTMEAINHLESQIGSLPEEVLSVVAINNIENGSSMLSDLQQTPEGEFPSGNEVVRTVTATVISRSQDVEFDIDLNLLSCRNEELFLLRYEEGMNNLPNGGCITIDPPEEFSQFLPEGVPLDIYELANFTGVFDSSRNILEVAGDCEVIDASFPAFTFVSCTENLDIISAAEVYQMIFLFIPDINRANAILGELSIVIDF